MLRLMTPAITFLPMSQAWDDIAAAFERSKQGVETLSEFDRDLYWIGSFIAEYEQGGLFYNWYEKREDFQTVIAAMRRRGLVELSEIVAMIDAILEPVDRLWTENPSMTWSQMQMLIDPADNLGELQRRIDALSDFGIPNSWRN